MTKSRFGVVVLVLAALVVASPAAATWEEPPGEPAGTAVITGRATLGSTGKPLKNADVWVWDWDTGRDARTTTDKTGRYRVEGLAPGRYLVSVSQWGSDALSTYSGNTVRKYDAKRFKVGNGTTQKVNIKAVRSAVLTGKVLDSDGEPVKGAWVRATNTKRTGAGEAWTDHNGRFTVRGLATGPVAVDVVSEKGTRQFVASRSVAAKQGKKTKAGTLRLKPGVALGTLTGKVTGVGDGGVFAYNTATGELLPLKAAHGKQGSKGKATTIAATVPVGTYRVVLGGLNTASKQVTVKKAKKAKFGTVKAPTKLATLRGTVKNADGSRAGYSYVSAVDAYGTWVGETKTDEKGRYRLEGVVAGKYTVTAHGHHDAPKSASVTVKKGPKNATKNLRLRQGFAVTGKVSFKGKGVEGLSVLVDGREGWTDRKGRFTVKGVTAGRHQLVVLDHYTGGYRDAAATVTVRKDSKKNVTVKR